MRIWIVASMVSVSMTAKMPHEMAPGATLQVRVYDAAQVKPHVLALAKTEAARIFKAGGINVTWDLPTVEAAEDRGLDMSVRPTITDSRHYVVVRIARDTAATVFPGALGFALPFAGTGAHATIFYDRIETVRWVFNTDEYIILGDAMAHEIGHVLLRSSKHAVAGMMQAHWDEASWRLASAGQLSFLPAERAAMGEAVRALTNPVTGHLD